MRDMYGMRCGRGSVGDDRTRGGSPALDALIRQWRERAVEQDERAGQNRDAGNEPNADRLASMAHETDRCADELEAALSRLTEARQEPEQVELTSDQLSRIQVNAIRNAERQMWVAESSALKADLAINAALLARQCDLARDAETSLTALQQRLASLLDYVQHKPECGALCKECGESKTSGRHQDYWRPGSSVYWHPFAAKPCTCGLTALSTPQGTDTPQEPPR